ncbi:hypothetical protein QYE76_031768 [Lolium multiflorum]|uniref:CCHC-type domain-containing protein n=1 Tax=Lolium multiflorum TaxID=4521 RepID=A0AAD8QTH2_LOLMU|nr:hypothetical protein QYE76_031768 [Lolium multiflorum]
MRCHTCGGKGHFKRDCPNRKVMFINEDNEYETGDDVDPNAPDNDDYDTDGEDAYPSDARTIVVSQRALNVLPSASTQRCNLFQTKALVGPDKACKVIIDGGSCRNLASKELCTKLKLKYLPHPHPYYIQWLSDNGEMKSSTCASTPGTSTTPSTARHSRTCCTRGALRATPQCLAARSPSLVRLRRIARDYIDNAVIDSICASSTPWRVSCHRRSDQPTPRTSTPSTSPSTRLPPIEHRGAAVLPLRAAAPPPLVHVTGLRRAFRGVYVAGGLPPLPRLAPTPAPQVVSSLHAVTFAVPHASMSEATIAPPLRRGSPPSAHGLRHAAGLPRQLVYRRAPHPVRAGLANHFRLYRLRHRPSPRSLRVSITLLPHHLACGYINTAPDHDIDHGNPSRGSLDQGCSTHALGYLDIGIKGYHLACASPASSTVQASATQLRPRRSRYDCGGVSACWFLPSASLV